MELVTVRLDRVFDIARPSQWGRGNFTMFSFDADIGTRYGVTLPGSPRIESGMTVTVSLSRENDWRSIVGWRDHSSGKIVMASEVPYIAGLGGSLVLAAKFVFGDLSGEQMAGGLTFSALIAGFAFSKILNASRIRRALEKSP